MLNRLLLIVLVGAFFVSTCGAQTYILTNKNFEFCSREHGGELYCFLPTFGLAESGFALFFPNVSQLNNLLGAESSTLPLPSPASGVTFTWDPRLGTFIPSRESLGPILSDRAETLGARRFSLAFTYQHFGFDSLNGQSLHQFNDVLAKSVDLTLDQFTTFLTWGLTRRVDVSVAVPVRTVSMTVSGQGFIVNGNNVQLAPLTQAESSSGISDITLRVKANVLKLEHGGLAIGADVRTPTGEPLKFLGSGAVGVKPFVIGSWGKRFRQLYLGPHLNAGYEWNGTSILGGALLGDEGRLPRRLAYAAGTEVGLVKRATITLDLNGQRLFNAERFYNFGAATPTAIAVEVHSKSVNLKDGSVGAKINPWGNLILTGNLSWRLDRAGLRARMVPLVGAFYTF